MEDSVERPESPARVEGDTREDAASEMVERAARAMWMAVHWDVNMPTFAHERAWDNEWPKGYEDFRELFRKQARAAIEAMREPTDEMLRASLATDLPATFRQHLRHPDNGPTSAKDTERRIQHERRKISNIIDAALAAGQDLDGRSTDGASLQIPPLPGV